MIIDNTTTATKLRPSGQELARELRRRQANIIRAQRTRELVAAAYALVAADLDERERRVRA
jgi:hypothetical protein